MMNTRLPGLALACLLACSHAGTAPRPAQDPTLPRVSGDTEAGGSAARLEQLTAPIALYPDALVAQIVAACTYPTEIVEADRWLQEHSTVEGQTLGQAVDERSSDPAVKALAQFPPVLADLHRNLAWASALGEAYAKEPQAVLDAVQTMRRRAQEGGTLRSTPEQTVATQGSAITVQPATPHVVDVPTYDPGLAYGAAIATWRGWERDPALHASGPGSSGWTRFDVVRFAGFSWSCAHWGVDWHARKLVLEGNFGPLTAEIVSTMVSSRLDAAWRVVE